MFNEQLSMGNDQENILAQSRSLLNGKYKLSNEAKNDLIRIHHYGVKKFRLPT